MALSASSSALPSVSLFKNKKTSYSSSLWRIDQKQQITEKKKKEEGVAGNPSHTMQDNSRTETRYRLASSIVSEVAQHVQRSRSLMGVESAFLSQKSLSFDLARHTATAVDLSLERGVEKLAMILLMLLAKRIHVATSFHTASIAEISQKEQQEARGGELKKDDSVGLHLGADQTGKDVLAACINIRRIIELGSAFISSKASRRYLIRRYVFVCLVEFCASPWHRQYKSAVSLFLMLHKNFRAFLPIELGTMLDYILLPLLESPLSQVEVDEGRAAGPTLKGFKFQLQIKWLQEKAIGVLGIIIDQLLDFLGVGISINDPEDPHRTWVWKKGKATAHSSPPSSSSPSSTKLTSIREKKKSTIIIRDQLKLRQKEEEQQLRLEGDGDSNLNTPQKAAAPPDMKENGGSSSSLEYPARVLREPSVILRKELKITVSKEYERALEQFREYYNKEDKTLKGKAVKYACRYLLRVGVDSPWQIADFLFRYSDRMNKVQIADYLATGDEKDVYHSELRAEYMAKIDLTQVDFAKAFRIFVSQSGFHVGGLESQRLNRMSLCFAEVYLRDNPDCEIHDAYGADALAQSLLFIHTIKFNKLRRDDARAEHEEDDEEWVLFSVSALEGERTKRRRKKNDKKPPTNCSSAASSSSNSKLVEDDFSPSFLERQYKEILSEEIGLRDSTQKSKRHRKSAKTSKSMRHKLRDKFSNNIRAAYAMLNSSALKIRSFCTSQDPKLISALLDEVGYEIYTITNDITERVALNSETVGMVQLCLEVCVKVICMCIDLDQKELLKWMLDVVGKRCWGLKQLEEAGPQILDVDPTINVADAKYQSKFKSLFWYKNVRLNLAKGRKEEAKQQILDEITRMNIRLVQLSHQTALGKLQKQFGDSHVIIAPHRVFIMKEDMLKVSESTNKKQTYTFFLFNDILVYGEKRSNGSYSIHRMLHLVLCRLKQHENDDLKVKICSSQKSFTILAPNKPTAEKWATALDKYITEQIQIANESKSPIDSQFSRGVAAAAGATGSKEDEDDGDDEEAAHKAKQKQGSDPASFPSFASSSLQLASQNSSRRPSTLLKRGEWVCTLCLKKHGRRTRRIKCGECGIVVCKSCATRKVKLKLVCDSCYGKKEMKFPEYASYASQWTQAGVLSVFTKADKSRHSSMMVPPMGASAGNSLKVSKHVRMDSRLPNTRGKV
eukprot:jgi/Bigna1/132332/aug1.17_g7040